jgi:hypothetical protein
MEEAVEGYSISGFEIETGEDGTVTKIENTYAPDRFCLTVAKAWDDCYDVDGLRPDSVTVQLMAGEEKAVYADGTEVKPIVLNASNNWTGMVMGLPVKAEGEDIEYSWKELDVPEGYTVTSTTAADNDRVTILTNTHEPKIDITVTKVWDDADDQDGIRPESVTAVLSVGNTTLDEQELSEDNEWTYTWTGLDRFENGEEIDYVVTEKGENRGEISIDGTTWYVAYAGDTKNGFTVINSHEPELVDVAVEKIWDDADDQDGIRPGSITVTLMADDEEVTTAVLAAANNWKTKIEGLPKYKDGVEIVYSWVEDPVPEGYTIDEADFAADDCAPCGALLASLTNVHTPETVQLTVNKEWIDDGNTNGTHPESVKVTLLADNAETGLTKYTDVELNEENGWSFTTDKDLPKFKEGKEIVYTWTEDTEGLDQYGYNLTAIETSEDGLETTITNTYQPDRHCLAILKVWDDENNRDGARPESITVSLLANGEAALDKDGRPITFELNEDNHWTAMALGVPKYADGKEIEYSWSEDEEALEKLGYTLESNVTEGKITTLTNTYAPETVEVPVEKVWDDAEDQDGVRPDPAEVTVILYADGVPCAQATFEDEYTFTDLPKYNRGEEIIYTVEEINVAVGYEAEVSGDADEGFTITNIHTPEETESTVLKVWDDADDQDGIRPDHLTVVLTINGEASEDENHTAILTEKGGWTKTIKGLPKYEDGKEIEYSWTEDADDVPEGYELTVETDGTITTLTNTYAPETVDLTITKVWDDGDDHDGLRPGHADFRLMADGEFVKTVRLEEVNEWTYTETGLDKYAAGKEIEYTWEEYDVADGYESSDPVPAVDKTGKEIPNSVVVTNTHVPVFLQLTVKKAWVDEGNTNGTHPDSVKVTLLTDNKETGLTKYTNVVLNEENKWTFTTDEDLPKYKDGKEIVYTWIEDTTDLASYGYNMTAIEKAEDGLTTTITNTYQPDKYCLTILKVWEDGNDQDGLRPESITVTLLANGKPALGEDGKVLSFELNAENTWAAMAAGVPKQADGKDIEYTWEEDAEGLPEGYELTNTAVNGQITTLTNSRAPETTQITVTKVWEDEDDFSKLRPASVRVLLKADGEYCSMKVLSALNEWTYTWEDLPVYKDGKAIEYGVEELNVPEAYTSAVSGDAAEGFTITNTYEVPRITISGTKTWDDENDKDKIRPETITVRLLADGKAAAGVEPQTVSAKTEWKYSFKDLPVYATGSTTQKIVYTVAEDEVKGYTAAYTTTEGEKETKIDIKNSHVPTCEITILKVGSNDTTKALEGAYLQITDPDGNKIWTWKSGTKAETVKNLSFDVKYTITELAAPTGYNVIEPITFTIKDDGTVETSAAETVAKVQEDKTLVVIDSLKVTPTPTEKPGGGGSSYSGGGSSSGGGGSVAHGSDSSAPAANAKTGDDNPITLYVMIGLAAAAVILEEIIRRRRRSRSGRE